jgi:hypothetical protein
MERMRFENVLLASSRKSKMDLPIKEQHMRSSPYLLATIVACGLTGLSTPRADAMSAPLAGLRAGLEAMDLIQRVDCRNINGHWVNFINGQVGTPCKPGVVLPEGTGSGSSVNGSGTNRSGNSGSSNSTTTNNTTNDNGATTNNNGATTNNTGTGAGGTTTNTGTGAGATTSTSTETGGATYTGAGAGATSTKATTTTGGATTTTGGTGSGATSSTTGGTGGGTSRK